MTTEAVARPIGSLSGDEVRALSRLKVFFGHQSVGADVIAGVGELLAGRPDLKWSVVESTEPLTGPALAHCPVGRNFEPLSKIQDFARVVRGGVGDTADVALFKFCYVDLKHGADVEGLFESYKAEMTELTRSYPRTKFAHVTVPIRGRREGWKLVVKRLLKRPDPFADDNATRYRFNELMRREYAGGGLLFDLAEAEATREDGTRCVTRWQGQTVPCMCPEYTYDAGHLNDRGRRVIAGKFLGFLAKLARGGTGVG